MNLQRAADVLAGRRAGLQAVPPACRRRWAWGPPRATHQGGGLDDLAAEAQRNFQRFVREQKLEERAGKASRVAQEKLQGVAGEVSDRARRTYTKLDSEYDISSRAQRAAKQAEESLRDVDQKFSVKRKLRSAWEEVRRALPCRAAPCALCGRPRLRGRLCCAPGRPCALRRRPPLPPPPPPPQVQRQWPVWSKRASEFFATPAGKVAGVLLFVTALQSGLIFQMLNWLLLLWWLSIPLSMALGKAIRKKQVEQTQQAQEEFARQQKKQANPFAGFWSAAQQSAGFGSTDNSGDAGGSGGSKGRWDQDGPVVDAEWSTLDDDSSQRRRR
jgi:hypothetical protein